MKHASNSRRGRPRGNGKRHPSKNSNFESNGPSVKIRGTAQQVQEKYLTLARDAYSAGDRIAAEGYYQFAEHYYRLASTDQSNAQGGQNKGNRNNRDNKPETDGRGNAPQAVQADTATVENTGNSIENSKIDEETKEDATSDVDVVTQETDDTPETAAV
ncbi:MAG: DUF4167 domain-containing protein [Rhodospirillales bacterium]|nr:DUF4167 domain-containing protein [Rhodospirillales bacterium]